MGNLSLEEARTLLFVPGDRPDRFAGAVASGADAVIIDLEDGVAPENKAEARRAAARWLDAAGQAVVRINSDWAGQEADLAVLRHCPGVRGVMVPKSQHADALAELHHVWGEVPLIALVETAVGVLGSVEIARAPGVLRLALGHVDLAADLGSAEDDAAMLLARSTLVIASRAAGIAGPIDSVTRDLDASEVTTDATRRARALGFTGKLCLNPRQVGAVRLGLLPTENEISWARGIIEAGTSGAVRSGTHMVDGPVLERARRILAQAGC